MVAVLQHEPALRFKDELGKDYPDWEKKQFSDIANKVSDSYSPEDCEERFECIELESLSSESGQVLRTFNSREQKSIKTKFVKGDVLFGKLRPYLRKYYRAKFDGVCTSEIWVLRPKAVSSKFLYSLVQGHLFNRTANIQSGSKMPRSDWNIVSQSSFMIPFSSDEQQKIAAFLSSIDTKIEQLSKKISLLEQYKKGMMQKLFSQEIRFKDEKGEEYPDWEHKRIKNIAPFQRGFDLPTTQVKEGSYPVVYSNGILRYHDEFKVRSPGVVTGRSGTIGKVTFVDENCWPHNTSLWVTDFFDNDPKYIYYFYIQIRLERYNAGSTVPTLNRNDVHRIKAFIPLSLEEQQKIAAFLSAIDKKIELITEQFKQIQTFKKGLLQQMFV